MKAALQEGITFFPRNHFSLAFRRLRHPSAMLDTILPNHMLHSEGLKD